MAEFVGKVTKKLFGKGSKSEHEAIYLETGKKQYVLRRQGGNPFYDPDLQELVGKTILCKGFAEDYVLTISEWKEADERNS